MLIFYFTLGIPICAVKVEKKRSPKRTNNTRRSRRKKQKKIEHTNKHKNVPFSTSIFLFSCLTQRIGILCVAKTTG